MWPSRTPLTPDTEPRNGIWKNALFVYWWRWIRPKARDTEGNLAEVGEPNLPRLGPEPPPKDLTVALIDEVEVKWCFECIYMCIEGTYR